MKNKKTGCCFEYLLEPFVVVLLCVLLAACGEGYVFDGQKTATNGVFQLDYALFDGKEIADMALESGSVLKLTVFQEEGSVDITVGIEGGITIYEGHGLTDMTFTLNVNQSGTYRITVVGHNAKGNVSVVNGMVTRGF